MAPVLTRWYNRVRPLTNFDWDFAPKNCERNFVKIDLSLYLLPWWHTWMGELGPFWRSIKCSLYGTIYCLVFKTRIISSETCYVLGRFELEAGGSQSESHVLGLRSWSLHRERWLQQLVRRLRSQFLSLQLLLRVTVTYLELLSCNSYLQVTVVRVTDNLIRTCMRKFNNLSMPNQLRYELS